MLGYVWLMRSANRAGKSAGADRLVIRWPPIPICGTHSYDMTSYFPGSLVQHHRAFAVPNTQHQQSGIHKDPSAAQVPIP